MATRGFAHPAVRLGRDRSRLTETSFPMNVRTTTWLEYIGRYLSINSVVQYATCIKYANVKRWGTRSGNDDKKSGRRFFILAVFNQLCDKTVIELNGSLKIDSINITIGTIVTIGIVNQNLQILSTNQPNFSFREISLLIYLVTINSSIFVKSF